MASCTRAQAVTFLWRAAGSSRTRNRALCPSPMFPTGSYYYEAVLWAVENGITRRHSDTTFSPNADLLPRADRHLPVAFREVPRQRQRRIRRCESPHAYYADAVLWAVKEDITKGTTNTTFSPDADCTRAQIVTFLWRMLSK